MSHSRNLPEEVLLMILNGISNSDLNQCQRVCRSWYNIAHLQFLQSIRLEGTAQIDQFIGSIDSNMNPSYLNAVKKISIDKKDKTWRAKAEEEPHLDKPKIRKLLFRFPNLTDIRLWDTPFIYEPLDSRLCNELLKKCPKLKTFKVEPDAKTLYKFRKIVTEVMLYDAHYAEDFGGITKFLCSFPRLTSIDCHMKRFETFKNLLLVFEKLPNITSVKISEALYDKPSFGDIHIGRKKQENQDILVKRLSNVTDMFLSYKEGFCENSMQFICRYFTGLKEFRMLCYDYYGWSNSEVRVFCNDILDFALSLESKEIMCHQMSFDTLSKCLPTVIQKALAPANENSTLHFYIHHDEFSPADTVELTVDTNYVNITASREFNINQITSNVFGTCTPMDAVDNFILSFDISSSRRDPTSDLLDMVHGRSGPKAYSVKFYDKILQPMPSLKEVSLDIPPSFKEIMKVTCEKNHPLVTKLTLKPSEDGQYQSMLNWCFLAFPNLTWLNIHHSSGLWNESIGRFEIILHKYTLEKLTIDMTPVKRKTIKHLEKQGSGEDFFVLEVESLASNERQLYKIPIDFSSSTSIKETDLKGSLLGEDYLRVNIIVRSAQVIELLMESNESKYSSSLHLINPKRITLQTK